MSGMVMSPKRLMIAAIMPGKSSTKPRSEKGAEGQALSLGGEGGGGWGGGSLKQVAMASPQARAHLFENDDPDVVALQAGDEVCALPDDVRDGHDPEQDDEGQDAGEVQGHKQPPAPCGRNSAEYYCALGRPHKAIPDEGDDECPHCDLQPFNGPLQITGSYCREFQIFRESALSRMQQALFCSLDDAASDVLMIGERPLFRRRHQKIKHQQSPYADA